MASKSRRGKLDGNRSIGKEGELAMTIGDVLAVVAGVGSACFAAWALLLSMALLFNQPTRLAQQHFEENPWRVLLTGTVLTLLGIGSATVLLNQPNGIL